MDIHAVNAFEKFYNTGTLKSELCKGDLNFWKDKSVIAADVG